MLLAIIQSLSTCINLKRVMEKLAVSSASDEPKKDAMERADQNEKNSLASTTSNPLLQREAFAVALRKESKKKILQKRREKLTKTVKDFARLSIEELPPKKVNDKIEEEEEKKGELIVPSGLDPKAQ